MGKHWIKGKTFEDVYGKELAAIKKKALSEKAKKQFTGSKLSEEHKKNIGKGGVGKVRSEKARQNMSKAAMGKIVSEKTKKKLSKIFKGKPNLKARGKNSGGWKGGISSLSYMLRNGLSWKLWRNNVFERDDHTCRKCFKRGGELHPHHRKHFSVILKEFLKEYDQFSPIEDKETLFRLAEKHKPFWMIINGVTLCINCHKDVHKMEGCYGAKRWE